MELNKQRQSRRKIRMALFSTKRNNLQAKLIHRERQQKVTQIAKKKPSKDKRTQGTANNPKELEQEITNI